MNRILVFVILLVFLVGCTPKIKEETKQVEKVNKLEKEEPKNETIEDDEFSNLNSDDDVFDAIDETLDYI